MGFDIELGFDGLRIVVDCANGAASAFAPGILTAMGGRVTALSASPDGANINDKHENTDYFPGIELPHTIRATTDPAEAVAGAEYVVLSVPSHYLPIFQR